MKIRHVHDRKGKHPGTHGTPRRFTASLNEGEVDFLLGLCAAIGGDLKKSPRKYAARISAELEAAAGYNAAETDSWLHLRGALFLTNYEKRPSFAMACYNHLRDSVLGYAMMGDHVHGYPEETMMDMAELGDRIAEQLTDEGETIDDFPTCFTPDQPTPPGYPTRRTWLDSGWLNGLRTGLQS